MNTTLDSHLSGNEEFHFQLYAPTMYLFSPHTHTPFMRSDNDEAMKVYSEDFGPFLRGKYGTVA